MFENETQHNGNVTEPHMYLQLALITKCIQIFNDLRTEHEKLEL